MTLFRPFEPNPFLVNAFTMSDVSVTVVKPREMKDLIEGRAQQIEDTEEKYLTIPAGEGRTHPVTVADLTGTEELLCDPNRRPREELLVPEEHPLRGINGVEEFLTQHKLTRRAADALLQLDPLDATHLLVAGLPDAPLGRIATEPAKPEFPKLARSRLTPTVLLVKARDRRG